MMNAALSNRKGLRKDVRMKRATLVAVAGATAGLVGTSAYAQTYTPIGVSSSSYNFSIVVPATAAQTGATKSINASMDGGTGNLATNVWFEKGYDPNSGATGYGIPAHNTTFTSAASSTHIFTMPVSYGNGITPTNDAIFLGNTANTATDATPTGAFTFNAAATYSGFSILMSDANGATTFTATINYINGKTQTINSVNSFDWFTPGTIAYSTNGRCSPGAGTTATSYGNIGGSAPYLYQVDLTGIVDTFDPISSVSLTTATTSARISAFAISGVIANSVVFTGTDPTTPGTFDTTSQNFSFNGSPASFNSSDNVLFNDTSTSAPNGGNVVIAAGGVSPLSVAFANNAITYNFSGGSIGGTGSVFVNAGGIVNFAQLNTNTGQTNISSGTLNVASTGSIGIGALYLGSTGHLNLANVNQSIGSLNGAGTLSLSGTNLNIGSGGIASTTIAGTGNLIFAGTQTLSSSNSYVGSTTFNTSSANVTIASPAAFGTSTNLLVFKTGSTLSAANALTVATSNAVPYSFNIASGATVNFGGAFSMDLTGTGTLLGGTTTISVSTAGTVVSAVGPILGGSPVIKAGAGTLYLQNTSNSFSSISASAGVLEFSRGTLGATGVNSPILLNGGTLLFAPGNTEDITTDYSVSLNTGGGTINTNGNAVTFANGLSGVNLGALTVTGPTTGAGSLTIMGVVKATSLTTTGGSPLSPEILTFNGPNAIFTQTSTTAGLGIGFNTGDYGILNITNGASFSILGGNNNGGLNLGDQANSASSDGFNSCTGVINLSGATSVFNSPSQVFIGKAGGAAATNTCTGIINMTGGTFNASYSAGPTELGAATNGVGIFNISGGTVNTTTIELGLATVSSGLINLSGGTLNTTNIFGSTGASTIILNGGILNELTAGGTILASTLKNTLIQGTASTPGLTLANLNASGGVLNGNVTIAANLSSGVTGGTDGGVTFNGGTGTLILSGNNSYTGPTVLGGNLTFSQSGTTNLPGNISSSSTSAFLTQSGTGTTILGGTDSFPGGVNISAGVLQLQLGATLGAPTINLIGGAIGISADNVLSGLNLNNTGGAIQFNNYTSNLSFNNNGNLKLGAAVGVASGLSGNISGTTNLTYIGPGTLNLTGSNTYTGATNISGGILDFTALSMPVGVYNLIGGTFQYAPGNTTDLTSGGRSLNFTSAGGRIDTNTNNVTFSGSISNVGAGTLTKLGSGTLSLSTPLNVTTLLLQTGTTAFPSAISLNGSTAVVTASAGIQIGEASGDVGLLSLDNGAKVTTTGDINIADQVTGGTLATPDVGILNVNDTGGLGTSVTSTNLYVGKGTGGVNAVGTVNQTNGTVAVGAAGNLYVGQNGVGIYNLSGGTLRAAVLTIAKTNTSTGTFNLITGGNLIAAQIVPGVSTGSTGNSIFNFNGGLLTANASSGSFMQGLTTAAIGSGGAKINTNGNTITIAQNLSSGVAGPTLDGGVTKLGTGTLSLSSGVNSYTGGTVVSAGTLNATKTGALGSGPITLGGGTLVLSNSQTTTTTGTSAFTQINAGGSYVPTNTGTTLNLTGSGFGGCNTSTYIPVTINDNYSFSGSFTYVHTTGAAGSGTVADGISFGFQNDPRGLSALGAPGGGEGYNNASATGITNSIVGFIDLYNYQYGNGSNGTLTAVTTDTTLPSTSGQAITFNYNGVTKTFTTAINGVDTTTEVVDIAQLFGGSAGGSGTGYVGFSAGTGGSTANQSLTNVVLTNTLPAAVNISNAVITSPGTISTLTTTVSAGITNTSIGTLSLGSGSTLNITSTGTGYALVTGAVSLTGLDTLDVSSGGNVLLGALNDGGSSAALVVEDAGKVTLAAPATSLVNGTTVFVGSLGGATPGNLVLAAPGALGTVADVLLQAGSTVSLGANQTFGLLASGASPVGGTLSLNGNTLTLGSTNNQSGGFTGSIVDGTAPGSLIIGGTGSTVSLAGSDSYTGLTTVNAGATLNLATATALAPFDSVAIQPAGTLNLNFSQSLGSLNGSGGSVVLNGTTLTIGGPSNLNSSFGGVISDGSASGSVIVGGTGTLTLSGVSTFTGLTTVNAGATLDVPGSLGSGAVTTTGTVNFGANTTLGGIYNRSMGALTINIGGVVTVGKSVPLASRTLLTVSSLSIAGGIGAWSGSLDLANNDLIVQGGSLTNVTDQVKQGYAGGTWQGSEGITSSVAASNSNYLTALGVIINHPLTGSTPLYGAGGGLSLLFDGTSPGFNDVLVKYTYYGDSNLDGTVDGSDYSAIDAGFGSGGTLTGWANGDFNYDGVIDGSDYTLIDNVFNTQGAVLTAAVASPSAEIGGSAVPEPTILSLLAIGAVGLLGRRRRLDGRRTAGRQH